MGQEFPTAPWSLSSGSRDPETLIDFELGLYRARSNPYGTMADSTCPFSHLTMHCFQSPSPPYLPLCAIYLPILLSPTCSVPRTNVPCTMMLCATHSTISSTSSAMFVFASLSNAQSTCTDHSSIYDTLKQLRQFLKHASLRKVFILNPLQYACLSMSDLKAP